MNLTLRGFDLTFTQPADVVTVKNRANYKMRRYRYEYKKKPIEEGVDVSTQVDVEDIPISNIQLSKDGGKVSLIIDGLKQGYIYELKLGNIKSQAGQLLNNKLICYTLNKLRT